MASLELGSALPNISGESAKEVNFLINFVMIVWEVANFLAR